MAVHSSVHSTVAASISPAASTKQQLESRGERREQEERVREERRGGKGSRGVERLTETEKQNRTPGSCSSETHRERQNSRVFFSSSLRLSRGFSG